MAGFVGSPTQAILLPSGQRGDYVFFPFFYIHRAGAGTGQVNLGTLPRGHWLLPANQSRLETSQFAGPNTTIDIGNRACVRKDNVPIDEHADGMVADLDPVSAAIVYSGPPADVEADLASEMTFFATIADGDIADGEAIWGWLAAQPLA